MSGQYRSCSDGPRSRGVPAKVARRVMRRDTHRCQIAGPGCAGEAIQVDHIVPVFEGGVNELSNLQAVCGPCHEVKTQVEAQRARMKLSRKRPPMRHPAEGVVDWEAWGRVMGR